MQIPNGLTEQQVLRIIEKVSAFLAPSHTFGYYTADDIKQEMFILAMNALPDYDDEVGRNKHPDMPSETLLENFLFRHLQNRGTNLYRDKFRRSDPPCKFCKYGNYEKHENGLPCETFLKWKKRNNSKADLCRAGAGRPSNDSYYAVEDDHTHKDMVDAINEKLPANLRADYLRLLDGAKLSKVKRDAVRNAITEILKENDE